MKKTVAFFLCVLLAAGVFYCGGGVAADEITVRLNGAALTFENAPVMHNGRVLVPMRTIFEAMGCEVAWEEETGTVTAGLPGGSAVGLRIGSFELTRQDDSPVRLDAAPQLFHSMTYVPVRAISEALGADVSWDEAARAVDISYAVPVSVSFKEDDFYFDWEDGAAAIDLSLGEPEPIVASGVYALSGALEGGSVTVNVDKETDKGTVFLVLDGADISNSTGAPIHILEAKKVVLLLPPGTKNTVYGGPDVTVDESGNPSAAIFSKADLTIAGSGSLSVTGEFNDGITSKDKLKITGGVITVNAKADGIVGKDVLAVYEGALTITAGKDGLRSTNGEAGKGNILIQSGTVRVDAQMDAIAAKGVLQIDGGAVDVTSGGGYPGASIKAAGMPQGMGQGGPLDQMEAMPERARPEGQMTAPPQGERPQGGMGTPPQGERPQGGMGTPPEGAWQGGTPPMTAPGTEAGGNTASQTEEDSKKGLKGTGGILINGGTVNVSAYDDAVHSNTAVSVRGGSLTLETGDDAVHADGSVTVSGGSVTVKNSYEGLEGKNVTVGDGTLHITASDDGLNVNDRSGAVTISGGEIYINAGGDGIDSNASVRMTGGTVLIDGPTAGADSALDADGTIEISGGVLAASGSVGMAQSPSDSSPQPSVTMYYTQTRQAGVRIALKDSGGNEVIAITPAKAYQTVVLSSPELSAGAEYTLYSDDQPVVAFTLGTGSTYVNESGVTQKAQGGGRGGMGPNRGAGGTDRRGEVPAPQ